MDLKVVQGTKDELDTFKLKYDRIKLTINEGKIDLCFLQNGVAISQREFFTHFRMGGTIELTGLIGYFTIAKI